MKKINNRILYLKRAEKLKGSLTKFERTIDYVRTVSFAEQSLATTVVSEI